MPNGEGIPGVLVATTIDDGQHASANNQHADAGSQQVCLANRWDMRPLVK